MTNNGEGLITKLGLKPGVKAYTLHEPIGYQDLLPSIIPIINISALSENIDWIQAFYFNKPELEMEIDALKHCLAKDGQIWISWPKMSSKVVTDLSDDVVRKIGLNKGLVDIKVVSISEVWSGLKFVYRLKDRKL